LAGSNGGGPKSCGGGGCDEEEFEEEAEEEAETIRSLSLRRGRGRVATAEAAEAAAVAEAGERIGGGRAALRPATRQLALPAIDAPDVDAAAPERARAAEARGIGNAGANV